MCAQPYIVSALVTKDAWVSFLLHWVSNWFAGTLSQLWSWLPVYINFLLTPSWSEATKNVTRSSRVGTHDLMIMKHIQFSYVPMFPSTDLSHNFLCETDMGPYQNKWDCIKLQLIANQEVYGHEQYNPGF